MQLILFIGFLVITLGLLYSGAKTFGLAVMAASALAFKLVLWLVSKYKKAMAMRSEMTVKPEVKTDAWDSQVQARIDQEPDWSIYDEPAYLRQGKTLFW